MNVIQSPVFTVPAVMELPRDPVLTVKLKSGYVLESAALSGPGGDIDIENSMTSSTTPGVYSIDIGKIGLKNGLYDLKVSAFGEGEEHRDTQPRAVWVLDHAPEEIVFAHLADPHVGDPRASVSPSAMSPTERRLAVYRAASESSAQFMIITGDINSIPGNYKVEYKQAYREMLETVTIPLFLTTGNHDLYTISAKNPKNDGLTFWHRYFGRDRYDFRLGGALFVVLNTYDWPRKARNFMNQALMRQAGSYASGAVSRDQLEWLGETLAPAKNEGVPAICAGHHEPTRGLARRKEGAPGSVVPREEVADFLAENGCIAFLAGHTHANETFDYKEMKIIIAASSSSDIPSDETWGYNLCRLKDKEITCEYITVVEQL